MLRQYNNEPFQNDKLLKGKWTYNRVLFQNDDNLGDY